VITEQIGSWGSWMTSVYAMTYRVDGLFQHSDGFRDLKSGNIELHRAAPGGKLE
jgi:hypothetical protein